MLLIVTLAGLSYLANITSASTINASFSAVGSTASFLKLALLGVFSLYSISLAILLPPTILRTLEDVRRTLFFVLTGSSLQSLSFIYVWVARPPAALLRYSVLPPLSPSPGLAAAIAVLGVSAGLALLAGSPHPITRSRKSLTGFMITANALAVVLLLSRQMVATLLLGFLLFIYFLGREWHAKRTQRTGALLPFTVAVFFVGYILFLMLTPGTDLNMYLMKLSDSDSIDIPSRIALIKTSLSIFLAYPILGVGYGLWSGHGQASVQEISVSSPHNGLVMILAEFGLVGGMFVFLILLSLLRKIYVGCTDMATFTELHRTRIGIGSFIIPLGISMFISNSLFFPPPNEPATVQVTFVVWTLSVVCVSIKRYY
ncbi:MAG: O-antigen ligase family protein [Thermoleophilia bacterium]